MNDLWAIMDTARMPSYLTPLFWVRGDETEEMLREEIGKLSTHGVGGFIVESRPHDDFLGPSWWWMMDIILDEAGQRGMRVWVFDDKLYPSGYAAGAIRDRNPEYLKVYLREAHIDANGPRTGSSFHIRPWLTEHEQLVRVVAAQRVDGVDALDSETLLDLTERVHDGVLYWDIPAGFWRVFVFIRTRDGGEDHTAQYLNPLDPEPVRVYLDTVYETHYAHYATLFGNTFAGFFSDEPRFGNAATYEARLGHFPMPLPFSDRLLDHLQQEWGSDFSRYLPCLWYDAGAVTAHARFTFMQVVTRLYEAHFSRQIGDWCRAHGVKLIGHVVEDNGAHARLGYGAGHFHRAMAGYDYSGFDVVYQVWPEYTGGRLQTPFGYLDADFFYWGLSKLASSYGHLDAKKAGITVCEVFGAYGWQEGLKLMKWLTDHICVRGANFIIPHAISMRFPDADCPPHFSAHGNPQWRYFPIWAQYANRVCHLLTGGQHIAPVAVLYHAEAEWAGAYEPFEKAVKALAQRQIDCDIVPIDLLLTLNEANCHDAIFTIHQETFQAIVAPYAEYLPAACLRQLLALARRGVPVIFLRDLPRGSSDSADDAREVVIALRAQPTVCVCSETDLPAALRDIDDVRVEGEEATLRYYHYLRDAQHVYFFTNESTRLTVDAPVRMRQHGTPMAYDALHHTLSALPSTPVAKGTQIRLRLEPYQSLFIIFPRPGETPSGNLQPVVAAQPLAEIALAGPWTISTATTEQYPQFHPQPHLTQLGNLATPGLLPTFSGTIRYETVVELPAYLHATRVQLDLGDVYEIADVMVNGHPAGACICPPYRVDITDCLTPGANTVTIDVTNTLAKQYGDNVFDRAMPQEPSGLLGPVRVVIEEIK